LARALEFDELGRLIQTDGISFGPPLAQVGQGTLQLGDVLVWYASNVNWKTRAIQELSHGPFSHVGIYVGSGNSVDAGPAGVTVVPITNLIENFAYGWVFRKPGLTQKARTDIVQAALANDKKAYAWLDAIALPARRRAIFARGTPIQRWNLMAMVGRGLIACRKLRPPSPNKTFCSRMVIEAFAAIGYFSCEQTIACTYTPFDLAAGEFFEPVGWLCAGNSPVWHPFDPYSPHPVAQRKWAFSPMRIWFAK